MDKSEFSHRRQMLMDIVGKNGIALVPTAPVCIRNRGIEFPYRPDSDFYYLTGFAEPEALAVFVPEREEGEYLLFCRESDQVKETWHGRRAGLDGAREIYGADDAFPITDIDDIVPGLLENRSNLFYAMGCYPEFDDRVVEWMNQLRRQIRKGVNAPKEITNLDRILHEMRLYKSEAEIHAMRQAIDVSISAHKRAMRSCRAGLFEYEIEADINHEFAIQRAVPSYPAIVGSGENTCILHYTDNSAVLKNGDLLLIDAGAEVNYYAADITRTFPINGRFSELQRIIYELVLKAQQAAIDEVYPDNFYDKPHEAAVKTIVQGLIALDLLKGDLKTIIEKEAYKRFYMHRVGHWIGMDVHDVGDYKIDEEWRVFEPSMVLTIEPGIYIPAGSEGVDKKWWNIGVRIEDNVLVTETGCEILTAAMPKTVKDIEALMAGQNDLFSA